MNILITGGTGLIGSAFIHAFHEQHKFTVLTRRPEHARSALGSHISAIHSLSTLANLNAFDAVINLAGEGIADKRWNAKRKRRLERSRWQITDELVALFEKSSRKPAVFISGSAVGYYGRQSEKPVTERDYIAHDEYSHQLCKVWEDKARAAEPHTRVCILRTGVVLAAEGGALKRMVPPFRFGLGGPIGSGTQMMSWIHLNDMIHILDFLLHHKDCSGVYNATAPNPVSNALFSQTIAKVLHRPCVFRVPGIIMKLAFGEMADLLLTGQAALPERLQQAGYSFHYPELTEALTQCLVTRR
ncbi:TIGR01777 family oxidoreductase [Aliidiomarina celeris]|uniref:TIGR01777 family oxidoreductase n=1 Tax=Aliidiomarina celeris TaxID=2249428 RepID=UPI000DE859AA|nr:TIGR01777 family oxidoreductase [Aliidiomarina celeris]